MTELVQNWIALDWYFKEAAEQIQDWNGLVW